jgi:hypothetical protein
VNKPRHVDSASMCAHLMIPCSEGTSFLSTPRIVCSPAQEAPRFSSQSVTCHPPLFWPISAAVTTWACGPCWQRHQHPCWRGMRGGIACPEHTILWSSWTLPQWRWWCSAVPARMSHWVCRAAWVSLWDHVDKLFHTLPSMFEQVDADLYAIIQHVYPTSTQFQYRLWGSSRCPTN